MKLSNSVFKPKLKPKPNINYRLDHINLINEAIQSSADNLNPCLCALEYIVSKLDLMADPANPTEFILEFTIPPNTRAHINLPIIESTKKDPLGYYVSWDEKNTTHNISSYIYEPVSITQKYHVKFFGLGIIGFGISNQVLSVDSDTESGSESGSDSELEPNTKPKPSPTTFNKFNKFNNQTQDYHRYLTGIISFGNLGHKFTTLSYAFAFCQNNFTIGSGLGPVMVPSSVTNLDGMFESCIKFNQKLPWDVSCITSMDSMFANCENFNQDLIWDVSNVINMNNMFMNCAKFNQELLWDVSHVKHMENMFMNCRQFNKLLLWDVSKVINMRMMFANCIAYNKPLLWNVSRVFDMSRMFANCISFNHPLLWDVSNVTNMEGMFINCIKFNQVLQWDVSHVINMDNILHNCIKYTYGLEWAISKGTSTKGLVKKTPTQYYPSLFVD